MWNSFEIGNNMKICLMGDAQSIHLHRWANYFIKNGHDVHIITTKPKKIKGAKIHDISFLNKEDPKIRVIDYFIYKYREYRSILILKNLLNEIKPDILNSHYMTFYGIMGSKLNFHPYIITCWGSDVLLVPNILGETYVKRMKKAFRKTDLITVESEHMNKSIEQLGINDRVEVVRHGVDLNKFNLDAGTDANLKQDIKSNDDIVIISTRNFEPKYNISCIIKGFHLLQKKIPNVKLILLGAGSMERQLKTLVKRLNISEKTLFFGHISHDEMPKYFGLSDIYVSSSLSDAMSVSKLEAMACGLIPVVSDIPANREVINDGENGFIFKNNPDNLSKKLSYCIKNYDKIKENVIKSNLKIIEETFNWNENMEAMYKLYKNVCEPVNR